MTKNIHINFVIVFCVVFMKGGSFYIQSHFRLREIEFNNNIKPYISYIGGFHLWGKKKSKTGRWTSHTGDLNTFLVTTIY